MYPVESGFWDRLDLSAQLGFNWDKSSEVGKYQLGVDAAWRDPRFITRGSFTTELTTQNEQSSTTRSVLDFSHMRFLENKRFRSVFGNLENNDELGLDLRALLGIGYGWIPVRSQHSLLGLVAGVDVNHEIPNEGSAETNYELVGTLLYEYYLYSHPKRQFSVDFSIFPSITQRGRYRASLNTSFKIELIKDLYWDLSAYGSYDNQPLSEQGSSSDYGVNSSIGYNF